MLAPEEERPEVAGDLKLVDVEDGAMTEITVTERLLRDYRHQLDGYSGGLADFCLKRGMTFLRASSRDSVEDVGAASVQAARRCALMSAGPWPQRTSKTTWTVELFFVFCPCCP